MEERLHKYLAHCGVASRRKAEEIIQQGRVQVDGEVVTELGVKIDPTTANVRVDGKAVRKEKKVYYLLHKPRGVTTTAQDEHGRKTVLDLLGNRVKERVYPVGRLDRDSEGLLVLTNDGELAFYLTHPACGVKKLYQVTVEGYLDDETLARVAREGVRLGPVLIKPEMIKPVHRAAEKSTVRIVVGEGVNREVRRLFAALGHEVKRLVRLQIGPLSLKGLGKKQFRPLTAAELNYLREGMKKADMSEADEAFPPGSAALRKPRGPRGRKKPRLGKPDPAGGAPKKGKKRKPVARAPETQHKPKRASTPSKPSKQPRPKHPLG